MNQLSCYKIVRYVHVPLTAPLPQDGTGMVGQIVFAWRSSAGLDARCKQWRLFADVLNDAAICLELAAPALGAGVFKVSWSADGPSVVPHADSGPCSRPSFSTVKPRYCSGVV